MMANEIEQVEQHTSGRKHKAFLEETESKWNGPFCFIQSADTQFGMLDFYVDKVPEIDVKWTREIERTRTAILAANRMRPKPRFFIVCGDLVDAMPGTMHRKAQEEDWNKVFLLLSKDIPLVCVCGNHDIGNRPTEVTIQNYVKAFGHDDYFSFWCGGAYNIVLNSQFFEDSSQVQELAGKHLQWIDDQLAYAKAKAANHIFIFQHIPFFLHDPNEAREYFNIENPFRLTMLEKLASAGVKGIFCGHYHRNAGGKFKQVEEVVTSAIGAVLGEGETSGLRVVNVYQNRFDHTFYPLADIPLHPGLGQI